MELRFKGEGEQKDTLFSLYLVNLKWGMTPPLLYLLLYYFTI